MPRGKSTIGRDSVFRTSTARTTDVPIEQGVATPDKPRRHQTGLWLTDEEVEWLEHCCQQIRRGGWRSVTRSAIVRALIQATMERGLDLEGTAGEQELVQRLTRS